ncbi:F0F1 ATP synthase subunit B [Labrys monachus]|uniref:ATP synthase subunit b n=1 Tax=Labrys monachus TaxID=217067 RepID=A0ABU0FAJ1_9HYPH|nr:F0F1 ATP synthase subunit B [Labrys monachus]MDQ0391643.1 F-type H+-transporting ATPase subunit b [Labrys monachus]
MAATTAGTEVPAESHKDGAFPPFDSSTFASQIVWLVIAFGLLYLLMSRIALPRVAGILDDRAGKIAADLDAARKARAESDAALATYETSLAQARAKAQNIAAETRQAVTAETNATRQQLEAELSAKLATAETQITATKTAALGSVNGIAVEAAAAIVEQLIGKAPDAHTVQAAVDAAVSN